jgi:hypothetical protein
VTFILWPEDVEAWIEASAVMPKPEEPQLPPKSGRTSLPPSPESILRKKAKPA